MKIAFVLYVLFFDHSGNIVTKELVSQTLYEDKFSCMVAKVQYKESDLIKFDCEKVKNDKKNYSISF